MMVFLQYLAELVVIWFLLAALNFLLGSGQWPEPDAIAAAVAAVCLLRIIRLERGEE